MRADPRLPIVCDLGALSPSERMRRAELARIVRENARLVEEIETGYRVHLRRDDDVLRSAEALIALEGRCCSFLTMTLRRDDAILELTGAEGAKAFIAAEMDLL